MTESARDFQWKQVAHGITINGPKNSQLFKYVQRRQEEESECCSHYMSANLINERTRRYRRGKNRCHRCGWPVLPEDMKNDIP